MCFTDDVTYHTQSYIVFMAKSSLAQLYCMFLETRNWFLLHLLSHQHAQHVASFQSTFRQAFHNGTLSQLLSYKDGWGTASALLGFSCELVRMTRKLVTIKYKEHSGGICNAREDLFLEVWLRMGKWGSGKVTCESGTKGRRVRERWAREIIDVKLKSAMATTY